MIRRPIGKLTPQRRKRIHVLLRETNVAAQMFFSDAGFLANSIVFECYEDTGEDGYEFVCDLDGVEFSGDQFCDEWKPRNRMTEYLKTRTRNER